MELCRLCITCGVLIEGRDLLIMHGILHRLTNVIRMIFLL